MSDKAESAVKSDFADESEWARGLDGCLVIRPLQNVCETVSDLYSTVISLIDEYGYVGVQKKSHMQNFTNH